MKRFYMKRYLPAFFLLSLLILGNKSEISAATITSNVVSMGDWDDPATWAGGIVPGSTDDVIIANGAIVSLNSDAVINSLTIGQSSSSSFTTLLIEDGFTLNVSGNCEIVSGATFPPTEYSIYVGSFSGTGIGSSLTIGGDLSINALSNTTGGINLVGEGNIYLAGNMLLPNNKGFLNADVSSSVFLNGTSSQQIFIGSGGSGNSISYNNLVIQGDSVYFNSSSNIGIIEGDLSIETGAFDNSNRNISIAGNISVAEGSSIYIRGASSQITSATGTGTITLDGKAYIQHSSGISGTFNNFNAGNIAFGTTASLEFIGSSAQSTGLASFSTPTFSSVIISNTAGTTLDVSFITGDLLVSSGAIFNASGYNIEINGDLIVDASGSITAPDTVLFANGSGSTTSGVVQFENVVADQAVNFAGADTVNGVLTLNAASSVSGSLAINLNTGYVDPSGTASISGNINFFKSVSHNNYSYLSFPVSTTVANIKSAGFQTLYAFDQSLASPWVNLANSTTLSPDGTGYACGIINGTPEVSVTGAYDNTKTSVSLTLNSTGAVDGNAGYNMIGNPYPFNMDWDLLMLNEPDASDLYAGIYYNIGGSYQSYISGVPSGGNIIPPFQGFMVYLSNSTGSPTSSSFEFNRGSAATGSDEGTKALYRTTPITDVLKLEVDNGEFSDATYIRLTDDATTEFDGDLDAFKWKSTGNVPSFYSYLGQNIYSINSVPATFDTYSMPLALEAKVAGSYSITLSEEYAYYLPYEILLEDKHLGIMHSLSSNPEYSFETDLTESIGRFAIHFKNPVITSDIQAQYSDVRVFSNHNKVFVEGLSIDETSSQIKVFDLTGRELKSFNNVDIRNKSFTFDILSEAGVYIVNIQSGNKTYSEKVVIY